MTEPNTQNINNTSEIYRYETTDELDNIEIGTLKKQRTYTDNI